MTCHWANSLSQIKAGTNRGSASIRCCQVPAFHCRKCCRLCEGFRLVLDNVRHLISVAVPAWMKKETRQAFRVGFSSNQLKFSNFISFRSVLICFNLKLCFSAYAASSDDPNIDHLQSFVCEERIFTNIDCSSRFLHGGSRVRSWRVAESL